jgi:hypothetical protein
MNDQSTFLLHLPTTGLFGAPSATEASQTGSNVTRLRKVTGPVIKGDQRGRTLGFPTANIDVEEDHKFLRRGVYAVWVELEGHLLPAVAAYGKPMFSNDQPPLETHIFDFSGDIYGRQISVYLVSFLRESKVFTSLDELMEAMNSDAAKAREILAIDGEADSDATTTQVGSKPSTRTDSQ